MKANRIFLIVADSFGIGALPDAADYSDSGANTLLSLTRSGKLIVPTLISLGLSNITGVDYLDKCASPIGSYARMSEISRGKDTTIGHYEIAGLVSERPFPTYPNGFPSDIIQKFKNLTDRKVICNKPYSGTEVIKDYGDEHIKTGALIVYTSADSVFQIAAHDDIIPLDKLYEYCTIARNILVGDNGVGRVIARPFTGVSPDFVRTSDRRDFSLEPHGKTMLDILKENGFDVISVGKIGDIFSSRGITRAYPTHSDDEGMEVTLNLIDKDFSGLCFTNLVEFDSLYGHRNDANGYATHLSEFDKYIAKFMERMHDNDILMITGDHGCDPGDISTDHTREYTPLLIYGKSIKSVDLGTRSSFADIASTICEIFNVNRSSLAGESFAQTIVK